MTALPFGHGGMVKLCFYMLENISTDPIRWGLIEKGSGGSKWPAYQGIIGPGLHCSMSGMAFAWVDPQAARPTWTFPYCLTGVGLGWIMGFWLRMVGFKTSEIRPIRRTERHAGESPSSGI